MSEKSFQIRNYSFDQKAINNLAAEDHLEENWPVVYQIYNNQQIYIGETTNLKNRMNQHPANVEKSSLRHGSVKVVFDETFNKSAALDLESYLIQYFSGDGKFKVLNRNDGMCDRDYYDRANYRKTFEEIWNRLRELKIADKTISEINNSELFKFSPYKNLNFEQLDVVTEIVQNIDEAICDDKKSLSIIDGDAGTGKTIVIMYLAKLLADLQSFDNQNDDIDDESNFNIFFELEHINQNFKNKSIALVIPQPSLCGRIRKIFDKIDLGDANIRIFSPIQFGKCDDNFDITLVDEAHLLKVGVTGTLGKQVHEIDQKIFGDTFVRTDKTPDAFINSLPVCNLAETLSDAKSARDALINEATAFLSTASELSEEERAELADLIGKAAAANTISDIEDTTNALRQAYDRIRGT